MSEPDAIVVSSAIGGAATVFSVWLTYLLNRKRGARLEARVRAIHRAVAPGEDASG